MDIALVTYQYPPTGKGGIANIAYNLYHRLKDRGHDVTLICNRDHQEGIRIFDDYKKIKGASYKNAWRILKYRSNYDWVIATEEACCHAAFFLAKASGSKLAVLSHGTALKKMLGQPYKRRLFSFVMSRADLLIANSRATLDFYIDNYPYPRKRNIIINPGIDFKKFDQKQDMKESLGLSEKKIVFTCGGLVKERNPEEFLEIMPALLKKYPDLVYVLAGDGPKKDMIMQRAKFLKVQDKVILLGHIKENIEKYYAMADIYTQINILEKNGGLTESFGMSLAEASASGKPSIIVNDYEQKDVIIDRRTGYICRDILDVAGKISYLLDNPDIVKTMGKNARELAKSFDWDNIITRYEEALS